MSTSDEPSALLTQPSAAVRVITLNRPGSLNAFTDEMLDRLAGIVHGINADESVAAVVLTGAGRAFCAGRDRRELAGSPGRRSVPAVPHPASSESSFVRELRPVVIAAAQGAVVGGGLGMFMQADIRIVGPDAYLLDGHVANGMVASSESWYLARALSMKRALEVCALGLRVGAHEAHACGLVDEVAPGERLLERALAIAATYAEIDAGLVRQSKHVLRTAQERPYAESMDVIGALRAIQLGRRQLHDHQIGESR